jgi:hypothetical protein
MLLLNHGTGEYVPFDLVLHSFQIVLIEILIIICNTHNGKWSRMGPFYAQIGVTLVVDWQMASTALSSKMDPPWSEDLLLSSP